MVCEAIESMRARCSRQYAKTLVLKLCRSALQSAIGGPDRELQIEGYRLRTTDRGLQFALWRALLQVGEAVNGCGAFVGRSI